MGEAGYAENFVELMLGWMRQTASSIAGLFQSSGGQSSGGKAVLDWFSAHWLTLLLVLIGIGVVVDWIVWMIRWRPYWLWFHKRRVILDDGMDQRLDRDQLLRRYGIREEDAPRFHSRALPREDDQWEDGLDESYYMEDEEDPEGYEAYVQEDEEAPYDDLEDLDLQDGFASAAEQDPILREEADALDDSQAWAAQDAPERERDLGHISLAESEAVSPLGAEGYQDLEGYEAEEALDGGEAYEDLENSQEAGGKKSRGVKGAKRRGRLWAREKESQDQWEDLSPKKPRRSLFRRKRQEEDEDPFAVDDKAFQNLDDDFLQVVSEEPHPEAEEDIRIYARPEARQQVELEPLEPLAQEEMGEEYDERIGYQSSFAPLSGTARSRKARRKKQVQRQEGEED